MSVISLRIPVAAAALAVLAGCGPGPAAFTGRPGGLRAAGDPAGDLREALQEAYGSLRTLTGRVSYQEVDPRDGRTKATAATFKTDIARRWVRGHIDQSDSPNAKGAETLFLNDGKLTVRVKIGFVPITRTYPLDDPQVTSARNYRMDQTDFAAMVSTVLASGSHLAALGPGELLGRRVDLLEVTPAGLPDAARERVGLDPATHLPVARVAYAPAADPGSYGLSAVFGALIREPGEAGADTVVFNASLADERRNVELPPATWKF